MNVLMVTTHCNIGGITSYILTLSRCLVRRGCRVTVVSSGGQMLDQLKSNGIEHVTLDIRTKSLFSPKLFFSLPKIKRIIRERCIDIVHTHTRVTHVMGSLLCGAGCCAHVTTCHGFYRRRLGRKMFPCWGRAVIAISPVVEDHLIDEHGLSRDRVHMIRNGVDVQHFLPVSEREKQGLRRDLDLGDGKFIGIVGRVCLVKGQHIAVEAMPMILKKVPEARLVLVGTGDFEKVVRQKVRDLGVGHAVSFFDKTAQTGKIFPAFDCCLMPSLQEGLGLALMEAQACGLPVVASRVGGLTSLIEDGHTGLFVEPGSPEQLAQAVVRVLTEPEFARALGMRAREFIEQEGSAEQMAEKIFHVYRNVMRPEE